MPVAIGIAVALIQAGLEAAKIIEAMQREGRREPTPEEMARLRQLSDAAHVAVQGGSAAHGV